MRIALHADGGAKAGLGHLGRCGALAQAFAKRGHSTVFVDVPAECRPWLKERGFKTTALGRKRYDVIVADSYRLTADDLARLRRQASRLLVLDDLGTTTAPCDFILNGNLYAGALRYAAEPGASLLLGPRFAPMRREYWRAPKPRRISPRLRRLLITTGGAVSAALIERLIAAAKSALPDLTVTAVIGPFEKKPAAQAGVRYAHSPAALRPLLEACDAVVVAGGQTVYEAVFTGAPMLVLLRSADQNDNVASLVAQGAALSIGAVSEDFEGNLKRTLKALSPARRAALSARGAGLVDGRGALRVADILCARPS
ncbi:MAG: hypothetical protein HY403_08905 [Elusimicrobia bacterium]|nr:hypothetical protein [Elusimicrobiota bacterium]